MSATTTATPSRPAAGTTGNGAGPVDPVGPDLARTLRALKLSGLRDTLPERLTLARARAMGHAAFLELLLGDEVSRRDSRSAMLRARTAGLDPAVRLDTWAEPPDLRYDRMLWSDLTSLRFTEAGHGVLVLGPVGVGKTHLAAALGHIAIRRRIGVHFARADKLFARLRGARLDNTLEVEMRRLARVDLLIGDLCRHRDYADPQWGSGRDVLRRWGSRVGSSGSGRHSHRLSRKARSGSAGW